jgi:endonuclease I
MPPAAHRGNVARAMFYFSIRYNHKLDSAQESALKQWHKADPVDACEKKRNEGICKLQGNRNPFIDRPDFVDKISDF